MPDGHGEQRRLELSLEIDSEHDLRLLRGAVLAAKATELAEAHRRGARLSFGYGSDSAREDMNAEIAQSRRRADLLDHLLKALSDAEEAAQR